jgi:predicted transcriptional regulator
MSNNVIRTIRNVIPKRPLSVAEALKYAEAQASQLLRLLDVTEPPVSEDLIADLPHVLVERVEPTRMQAAAKWLHGWWLVLVNGAMSRGRQRFSLAHEFKHILDHPLASVCYRGHDECVAEQACDYFAACLLMPRRWLRQAWDDDTHDVHRLARRFGVSPLAVKIRLLQVGLIQPTSHYLAKEA